MAEHLRFGVCYWHTFAWDGFDIFGSGTLDRPWHPNQDPSLDPMDAAKMKMDAAFEFVVKLFGGAIDMRIVHVQTSYPH